MLNNPFFIKYKWGILFSLFLLSYSSWLLLLYPAGMSVDSVYQWNQAWDLSILDNTHPYLYTLLLAAFRFLFWNPVSVSLFQIGVISAFLASIFNRLIESRVRWHAVGMLIIFAIFSLPIGIYASTIWKDVLFSVSVAYIAWLLIQDGFVKVSLGGYALISIALLVIIWFRHNWILFVVSLLGLLFFQWQRRMAYYLGLIACMIVIMLQYILPQSIQIKQAPFWIKDVYALHANVGFLVREPATIASDKTKELLARLFKEKDQLTYNPAYATYLLFRKPLPNEEIKGLLFSQNINLDTLNDPSFWSEIKTEFFVSNLLRNLPYFIGDRVTLVLSMFWWYSVITVFDDSSIREIPLIYNFYRILSFNLFLPVGIICYYAFFWNKKTRSRVTRVFLFSFIPFIILLPILPYADWRYGFYIYLIAFFVVIPTVLLDKYKNTH